MKRIEIDVIDPKQEQAATVFSGQIRFELGPFDAQSFVRQAI